MSYNASRRHKLRSFLLCRKVSLKLEEKSRSGSGFTPFLCSWSGACLNQLPHILDHPGGLRSLTERGEGHEVRVLPLLFLGVRKRASRDAFHCSEQVQLSSPLFLSLPLTKEEIPEFVSHRLLWESGQHSCTLSTPHCSITRLPGQFLLPGISLS